MEHIEKAFKDIGSRVKIGHVSERQNRFQRNRTRTNANNTSLIVDIQKDHKGEYFKIDTDGYVDINIMNIDKRLNHLLLFAKDRNNDKYRFLCGLDERGWFSAAVPDMVSSIKDAMDSLKPQKIINAQKHIKTNLKNKRKNQAFLRQGEWFFIPAPNVTPLPELVLKNEPIRRGRGKPHMVEEIYRTGGQLVYVSRNHPQGVSQREYQELIKDPKTKFLGWRTMKKDMQVFGRGKVRHRDHKTIVLKGWHQILPNRETEAVFIENLVFLD